VITECQAVQDPKDQQGHRENWVMRGGLALTENLDKRVRVVTLGCPEAEEKMGCRVAEELMVFLGGQEILAHRVGLEKLDQQGLPDRGDRWVTLG